MKNFIILNLFCIFLSNIALAKFSDWFPDDIQYTNCMINLEQYAELDGSFIAIESILPSPAVISIHIIFAKYDPVTGKYFHRGSSGCPAYVQTQNIISSNLKALTNSTFKETIACGSVIDFEDKVVNESIPILGTSFLLNYSSGYNTKIAANRKITTDFNFNGLPDYNFRQSISYNTSTPQVTSTTSIIQGTSLKQFSFQSDGVQALSYSDAFKNIYDIQITLERMEFHDGVGGSYRTCKIINDQGEVVCSVGLPIAIGYRTENSSKTQYKPEVWGLKGWTVSEHHYFDKTNKILFTGDGQKISYTSYRTVADSLYGTVDVLIERNSGQEVYIFDQQGRHLETRHAIWLYPIYKFQYDSNNKLVSITDKLNKTTTFLYDGLQNITKIVSSYGIETQITTANGLISKATNALGQSYEMQYDATSDLMTSFKSINGVETVFSYTSEGDFVSESKNIGLFQIFSEIIGTTYKKFTHLVSYGQTESVESIVRSSGAVTKKYNSENELIFEKENSFSEYTEKINTPFYLQQKNFGQDLMWGNDFSEAKTTATAVSESNQSTQFTSQYYANRAYADISNPFSITAFSIYSTDNINDAPNFQSYDLTNKVVNLRNKYGQDSSVMYNSLGQVIQSNPYNESPTYFSYDNNGNLNKIQKGTQYETYTYDNYGYLSTIVNSKNQVTRFNRNIKGEVLEKILPNQDKIKFEYSADSEIKKITTPNGQVHNFQLSLGDYLSQLITPNNEVTVFDYDEEKRIKKVSKPSGREIIYNYKPNSEKLASIQTTTGITQVHNIDSHGRIRSVTSEDNIKTDINWALDQIQQQTWYDSDGSVIAKLTNTFGADKFKVVGISLNDQNFANYSYQNGQVSWINDKINFNYNEAGGVLVRANMDGLTLKHAFEDANNGDKPTETISVFSNSPNVQFFLSLSRSYDFFGQASEYTINTYNTEAGVFNNFYSLIPQYDENNRLIQIAKTRKYYNNGQEVESTDFLNHYAFPAGSNNNVKEFSHTLSTSQSAIRRTTASHNSNDQLIKLQGSINRDYTYSADGELKTMTNCHGTISYEYDSLSNLKKVTLADGKVIEYKVDGLNRRVKKLVNGITTEYYVWYDQIRLAAILDANKQAKMIYIYGPESSHSPSLVIKDGKMYKIVHDTSLGSIRYVLDTENTVVVQELEYDEHGNIMKNTNPGFQPLTFAGGLYDADTKLVRFGARDYDPTIGRWTTKDPIGFAGGDTNLYAYVGGNPMSYIDPNGLFPKNIDEAVECLHGNHDAVVNMLQNNINANQNTINELNKNNSSSENSDQCPDPKAKNKNANAQKTINQLLNTNARFIKQLNQLKEKCSFFPTVN